MDGFLIAARALHYASTISLAGVFAFLCVVVGPDASPGLRQQLSLLAWASLGLALLSGGAWLVLVSAQMSGQSVVATLTQGVVGTVLTRTRFGQVWVWRFVLALMLAMLLPMPQGWRGRWWRWAGLVLAGGMLGSLAWAGHGGATPGHPGDLHLVADILHLLAAGAWVGSLVPLALFLAELRRSGTSDAGAAARRPVVRFSLLAAISVAILFAGGSVNTWFLAGTVPALIGTEYGRLLLAKIAIFAIMATIAAVNLLRMTPRLAPGAGTPRRAVAAALGHLRRNALLEAGFGLCVLGIVAVLGILPPGLHTEPGWPLPFRLDTAALGPWSVVFLLASAVLGGSFLVAGVATAAAGRYRATTTAWTGLGICAVLGVLIVRPAVEPAYPTSFYAPAEPYAAASVMRGARLFAENCALCHGAGGKGDGPAAAALPIRPADLTAPHLFAHSEGDLFWWVSRGKGGVMPGFASVLSPAQRWDVINFVRARAAGVMARTVGPDVSPASAPAMPDFAFETAGRQQTLDGLLQNGPVLVALFSRTPADRRLALLAGAEQRVGAAGLRILAISLTPVISSDNELPPPLVAVAPDVRATLVMFSEPDDGGETDLLLDRAGSIRARWTAAGGAGLPDTATLVAAAAAAARFSAAAENHAGHAH
jgi:putative copper resistance protein D